MICSDYTETSSKLKSFLDSFCSYLSITIFIIKRCVDENEEKVKVNTLFIIAQMLSVQSRPQPGKVHSTCDCKNYKKKNTLDDNFST